MIGKQFGFLNVIGYAGKTKNRIIKYVCRCSHCGKTKIVSGECLRGGDTKSCGFLRKCKATGKDSPAYKHGLVSTRTYNCWAAMIQRCTNKRVPKYKRYGARGIKVCKRWMNFINFVQDMGIKPFGKTLGRIDNDGDYERSNCRWETISQQANNRINNRLLTFNGETKTVAEWSRHLGIPHIVLRMRLHRKWSTTRALTYEVSKSRKNVSLLPIH